MYKTTHIHIRCREEEKRKIEENAKKNNMSLSEYVMKKLLGGLVK